MSLLKSSGLLLALSGVAHFVIWLFAGGDWEGPVSWRKPILFGVSTGVTVLSVAWLYPKLRPRRWDAVLCGLFGFAMVAEVALITIQQWRGLPSHFNYTTTLDAFIEAAMTYCIVIVFRQRKLSALVSDHSHIVTSTRQRCRVALVSA